MIIIIFLLLLQCICMANGIYDCIVPATFSYDHKPTALNDASFSNIQKLAQSFEVDSHLEVIFVGNSKVRVVCCVI